VASLTGLTASLYTRLGYERILVARVDGDAPLRYDLPLGKRLPLTLGAAGKILLASASDDELQQVVSAALAAGHEDPALTAEVLRSRLPAPAADYAYSADERATGVLSVAVAVPRRAGQPTESMSLTSPVEAASEETLRAGVPELRRAAGRLSEVLEGSVY
jgi:IclR family acetate operon transcriptional repressor